MVKPERSLATAVKVRPKRFGSRGLNVDREVAVALILAPLVLASLNYCARPRVCMSLPLAVSLTEQERALAGLVWWSGWSCVAYLIIPALVLKAGRRLLLSRIPDLALRGSFGAAAMLASV